MLFGYIVGFWGCSGLRFWRPEAPFWEPWGPLVPPGAVLGARRGAEAILEAKNWFVGPLLGSPNRAQMHPKMVEKSYGKSNDFSNAFLLDLC